MRIAVTGRRAWAFVWFICQEGAVYVDMNGHKVAAGRAGIDGCFNGYRLRRWGSGVGDGGMGWGKRCFNDDGKIT